MRLQLHQRKRLHADQLQAVPDFEGVRACASVRARCVKFVRSFSRYARLEWAFMRLWSRIGYRLLSTFYRTLCRYCLPSLTPRGQQEEENCNCSHCWRIKADVRQLIWASREIRMKKRLVAAAIFAAHSAALNATPIEITIGSARITPFFATPFNDVNGVSLNGQSLSLNFVFTDNFIRLLPSPGFPQTAVNFDISVALHTNANGLAGFASGTGFIFDQTGQPLQAPVVLGSAASDDGAIFLGLFPLLDEAPTNTRFYGFNMDITLPNNPGFEVTDEDLRLFGGQIQVADQVVQGQFGIGPHIADTGSTAILFAFALLVLSATCKLRVLSRH